MSGIDGNLLRITGAQPVVFFDLDDTLYRSDSGVMEAISRRITEFVILHFGKSPAEAERLRVHWRELYGTALRGMREEGYAFDADSYFAFVHDISLDLIAPAPRLRDAISSLPARKFVLTNADANHAWRVLWRLGLQACFERVIDIKVMGFVNKPHVVAYHNVQIMVGADSSACVLIDDVAANTRGAMAAGWRAIRIADAVENGAAIEDGAAHVTVPDVETAIERLRAAWEA
jgi:putative hydrolase of the HAD superfamily